MRGGAVVRPPLPWFLDGMTRAGRSSLFDRLTPSLFVVIWATGFVVARQAVPHADPFTFLWVRFFLAAAILAAAAFVAAAPWPVTAKGWRDGMIAGVLLHGLVHSGVFWAISRGLPLGIAALIMGMQPLATGILVWPLLGEKVSVRRWAGIGTGFLGTALVIAPKLGGGGGFPAVAVFACLFSMISITLGTIWQKRTGGVADLRTNTALQYVGAFAVTFPLALLVEEGRFDNSLELWLGMAWAVLGLSIGGVGLLMILIRRGAVAGVASLLYLVPPLAAIMAYIGFGETLSAVQVVGMAIAALGVAIASRG